MATGRQEKLHKPQAASERLYSQLSEKYHMRLACDQCIVIHPIDAMCQTCVFQHSCSEHKLLLQCKTGVKNRDNWTWIRSRPLSYGRRNVQDDDICDYVTRGRQCPDGSNCEFPHSLAESDIWTRAKVDLSVFIDDVRTSSLLLRYFVARVCKLYDGRFEFICKKCFTGESHSISNKKQHVIEFECGHTGIGCKLLVFRSNNEPNKIITPGTDSGDNGGEDFGEITSRWDLLKTKNCVSDDEIYEESRRFAQASDAVSQQKQVQPRQRLTDDDYEIPEEYADQVDNGTPHILENNIFDGFDYVQTILQSRKNLDNSDFILTDKRKGLYYESIPVDELKDCLEKKQDLYKRCRITLKNHDNAECKVINTKHKTGVKNLEAHEDLLDRIEIRGRRNCGQCFSGDEVLVEILEHSGKEHKVPLGKVVGVLKHNIDCRSHVFVCSMHRNVPNLMIPVHGSAAIIRIVDSLIMEKHKNQRQSLVEVFDSEFMLRHIARLPQDMHRHQILFAVKLRYWNSRNASPLGYVIGILSPKTLEDEMKLLNIQYQISWLNGEDERLPPIELQNDTDLRASHETSTDIINKIWMNANVDGDTEKALQRFCLCAKPQGLYHDSCLFSSEDIHRGKDSGLSVVEDDFAITIDSNGTKCFEDAVTIRKLKDSTYAAIGVHITDATEHVDQGSELDNDAAETMEDWYTSQSFEHLGHNKRMFQHIRDACSLTKGTDKKGVISVYLIVDIRNGETKKTCFTLSKITIIENLSFEDAQKIINYSAADAGEVVKEKVKMLHEVAVKMRRVRLGEACNFYETRLHGELERYPDPRRLVEELSMTANRKVAELLTTEFPEHPLPLRRQLPPSHQNIGNWNKKNGNIRNKSFYFARPEWFSGIPNSGQDSNAVVLSSSTFNILSHLSSDDVSTILSNELLNNGLPLFNATSCLTLAKRIIGSEGLHPRHQIAMKEWSAIKELADFVCSFVPQGSWRHFDLNFDSYVRFTSPLRRYLDLVVQRILKSFLSNDDHPYEPQDIEDLCFRCNQKHELIKTYKSAVKEIDLVKDFTDKGSAVACTVAEFDDSGLALNFSNLLISYRHISIKTAPVLNDEEVHLTWELRRFNTALHDATTLQYRNRSAMHEVREGSWARVQTEIRNSSKNGLLSSIKDMVSSCSIRLPDAETSNTHVRMGKMFVKYSLKITAGMNLEVQFGNYGISRNGIRELEIELVYLPNNLDFCILHNQRPVECLSCSFACTTSTKETYTSIEHYQRIWIPILSLESATNAALGDTIVCENVPLCIASSEGTSYRVTLTLEKEFCQLHQLGFLLRKSRRVRGNTDNVQDFLCLRYNTGIKKRNWIAHGLITSCEVRNSKLIVVSCDLQHFNFQLPWDFSDVKGHCTVEFLIKNLTDRRREAAVRTENMNRLCKSIVLNQSQKLWQRFEVSRSESEVEELIEELKDKLNLEQIDAIQQALMHKFYLIHGPPGTGKTLVGVHLTRCLVERNRKRQQSTNTKCQVLYCGPSNSSVDVAASKLLERFGSEVVAVARVYSKTKETEEEEDSTAHVDSMVKSRSLHRLIRYPQNIATLQYSIKINEYEKNHGLEIRSWDKAAREYIKSLRKAEELELSRCDVVFCTLVTSASLSAASKNRVTQVIIDECGMSAEPDCLIALTSFPRIEQVVLIGDHKQLQPIVLNYDARRLGLGKSLFERYAESKKLTMLTKQYRMHDSICRFPSEHFYGGRLVTAFSPATDCPALPKKLWPVKDQRIMFWHLEGEENIQKVVTHEGNLFSKSNEKEQEQVIAVVKHLISDCKIQSESIAVLSQYKAQCSQLQRKLSEYGVHISTVVASQVE